MSPNVDERLASVIRALSEVILPHLPPEASLAQEQVHLCIGHLQILRSQIDEVPAFEKGERDDALALAQGLVRQISGGPATTAALAALNGAIAATAQHDVRAGRMIVLEGIDTLVRAVAQDGTDGTKATLTDMILLHEQDRTQKDRQWFAPFGFDTL